VLIVLSLVINFLSLLQVNAQPSTSTYTTPSRINPFAQAKLAPSDRVAAMRNAAAAETINGMSILKFFAWEGLIDKHVDNLSASDLAPARLALLRRQQVKEARKRSVVAVLLSVLNELACSLVAVTMFGVYSYMGKTLTLTQAFPALLYISIMKTAGNPFLGQARALAQAKRSLEKLSFFCTPKNMPDLVHSTSSPKQRTRASFAKRGATLDAPPEVRIKNGSFNWGANQTGGRDLVLRGINVVFPAGKLTAIIGKVGCGKTSLLAALLGEMNADPATVVQLGCAVALSSQEPFIRNASVRDNILFGCPMDSARYTDVLRVCALQADLNALPAGDMTEIGGKGSVLTPSQKQRISVARAVYCGADVYMFDDPLAPLTSAEASHVFSSCFLEHLADRTRILVTQRLDVLERADHIVCMTDEGGVLCCGSYVDISSKHPEVFSSLIKKRRSLSLDPSAFPAAAAAAAAAAASSLTVDRSHPADAAPSSSGAPDKAASCVTRETHKFYVDAMGRNYSFAVVLLGVLAQVRGMRHSQPHNGHISLAATTVTRHTGLSSHVLPVDRPLGPIQPLRPPRPSGMVLLYNRFRGSNCDVRRAHDTA